jgi:hypothetical protein
MFGEPFAGLIADKQFNDIAGLRTLTGGEHSIQIDMDVFAGDVEFPYPPFPEREPADLRIKSGSPPEDAATLMPNINDNFSGKGPDIGAYEVGRKLPIYGPRPEGMDEETIWIARQK